MQLTSFAISFQIRIIYRLVEFSAGTGTNNPLPTHEAYFYALDAVPMVIAASIMNILHPGQVLIGPESEFPKKMSRRERKAAKTAKKEAKRQRKHEYGGIPPEYNNGTGDEIKNLRPNSDSETTIIRTASDMV